MSYINLDGYVVSNEFYDFIVRLKNYDENLELAYLDGQMAELFQAPYLILERCRDGQLRKVFEVWELNDAVIERIIAADSAVSDILGNMDKKEKLREDDEYRRYRDRMDEKKELVETAVRTLNKKSNFKFKDQETGEKVTIFEDRPSERKGL